MDTVLENIASFSAEVRQINNQETPMLDMLDQVNNDEELNDENENEKV